MNPKTTKNLTAAPVPAAPRARHGGRDATRRDARAFTLIELLAVIFILMILATLVVTVSRFVGEKMQKQQTIVNEHVFMSAIESFNAFKGYYPPEYHNNSTLGDFDATKPQIANPGDTTNIPLGTGVTGAAGKVLNSTFGAQLSGLGNNTEIVAQWNASLRIRNLFFQLAPGDMVSPVGLLIMDPNGDPNVSKIILSRADPRFVKTIVPDQTNSQNCPPQYYLDTPVLLMDGYGLWLDYRDSLGLGGGPVLISAGSDMKFSSTTDNVYSDGRGQ